MKRSIFYFDDEEACLDVFRETFCGEYDVRTAATLAEARAALSQRPADIVISDQLMPEITGTEFLREVAANYPSSYRVMLTGSIVVGEALPEISSGIVHIFVPKPWEESAMRRALDRAASQSDQRRPA